MLFYSTDDSEDQDDTRCEGKPMPHHIPQYAKAHNSARANANAHSKANPKQIARHIMILLHVYDCQLLANSLQHVIERGKHGRITPFPFRQDARIVTGPCRNSGLRQAGHIHKPV
jgi:hypothetical protein